MNNKGQSMDFEKIIASIFAIFFLIIFFSAMIPIFSSLNGGNEKQAEIDKLNTKASELNGIINLKEVRISELEGIILSANKTLSEKENIIANLTGQLTEKDFVIENLTEQLKYYGEKQYLQDINNNYYNISNYFEKIENQFFPIKISISLISITLFALIIKVFGLGRWIKEVYNRFRKKESNTEGVNHE
ncbi:MAG: hypothetical protein AABW80_01755 [Nanoarchaeota archaeon]